MSEFHNSVWSDLTGVSFSQGFLDAGGIRTRFIASGSPDKPLLLLLHGTGGHAEAYSRNLGAHGEHFHTVAIGQEGGWILAREDGGFVDFDDHRAAGQVQTGEELRDGERGG